MAGIFFLSNFLKNSDEWQFYHPNGLLAQQWILNEDEGYLQLYEMVDESVAAYKGSWLQAPSFLMTQDMKYEIAADVEILSVYDNGNLSGKECVKVYASDIDLPSKFEQIGSVDGDNSTPTYLAEKSGIRYITLLAESDYNDVAIRLKGFKVKAAEFTGIESVCISDVRVDGNILRVGEGHEACVYTAAGVKLAKVKDSIRLDRGLYLVVVSGQTVKVIIK